MRRPVDLRLLLAALPVLALLPMILFAGGLVYLLAQSHETETRRELQRAAQAIASAIDREVAGSIRRLETIADLSIAWPGDLSPFERVAERELLRNADWLNIMLTTSSGRIVHALGTEWPPSGGALLRPQREAVLGTGRPVVSDLLASGASGEAVVMITVPVTDRGAPRWLLSVRLSPEVLSRWLADSIRRRGGIVELLDREGRIVARSHELEAWLGHAAEAGLMTLARDAESGTAAPFPAAAGEAPLGAWARLPFGWTVAVSAPADPPPSVTRSLWLIGVLGVLLLGTSVALGVALSRRITGIVAEAGRAARRVAAARPAGLGAPAIRQFSVLFDAMNEAGERVVDALERERSARSAAEAADRQKDRFLLMLGHELRNPLNAVANAGHLLRRRDLSAGQRDGVVDMLLRQSRQLRRLVDDLLDVGRVLTGRFELCREAVDVDVLLRQSIATLGATGQLAGHTVRADLVPVRWSIDPVRFEQVFTNLVCNAVKYTPGGGVIDVRLRRTAAGMILSVRDTGIGIEPAQLQRVFELFVQGGQPEGRAPGGLGVGLSMARMLVEFHGGTIDVRSDGRDLGSEFVVRIPPPPIGPRQA